MSFLFAAREADPLHARAGGSERYAELTGFSGEPPRQFAVPEEWQGLPVESIAGHALEGLRTLRCAVLPGSIRVLGGFSFYFCSSLEKLSLHDSIADYSDGVIRQCGALRAVEIVMERGNYRLPARILSDTDEKLALRLLDPAGRVLADLIFPAFSNVYREDTMARAIHPDIQGAGFGYRACVGAGGVDYKGYDALFPRAVALDPETAGEIALGRLTAPVELSAGAAAAYREHISASLREVLLRLLSLLKGDAGGLFAGEDEAKLAWLLREFPPGESLREEALAISAGAKLHRATGLLLGGAGGMRRGALSLEDF